MNVSELLRPFEHDAHKWRVMNVTKKGDKASCAFYIDARDVMDRLDAVVGAENWSDKYTTLAIGENRWAIECTITIAGVSKSDVGEGDAPKDAYSDALKRAAVKWGIGRYLYGMDNGTWFAVNEFKQFTPEAEKQIEDLLRKNLARLGVKPAQPLPLPTLPPNVAAKPASNGAVKPTANERAAAHTTAFNGFMAKGNELFGSADWADARHWLIKRWTVRSTPDNVRESANDLTQEELTAIRSDMDKFNGKLVSMWEQYKTERRAELDAITVNGTQEMAH